MGAYVPRAPEIREWLEAQPMTCHYSGERITPATMQIDHRTPVERGGSNEFTNLCLASGSMNRAKGTMTEGEFKALLALIATFPDGGKSILTRLKRAAHVYGR